MSNQILEQEILDKLKSLSGNEKEDVLNYLGRMPKQRHNTKMYRRKALKQIREALQNPY